MEFASSLKYYKNISLKTNTAVKWKVENYTTIGFMDEEWSQDGMASVKLLILNRAEI